MPRPKKAKESPEPPGEKVGGVLAPPPVEEVPEVVVESAEKVSFRNFIETYKAQSPEKYAQKEKSLLAQLDEIK